MSSKAVQNEMITLLPNMRAFAISLCGDVDRADDLVQEALLKAWRFLDSFTEGTNLRAWMFTILRNVFLSELRRQRVPEISLDADPGYGGLLAVRPEQHGWMDSQDMQRALAMLSPGQREAIVLIGAEGFNYEEAAVICGCAVGTIKSRVNRARLQLAKRLDIDLGDDVPVGANEPSEATPLPLDRAQGSDPAAAPRRKCPLPSEAAA